MKNAFFIEKEEKHFNTLSFYRILLKNENGRKTFLKVKIWAFVYFSSPIILGDFANLKMEAVRGQIF